MSSQENDSTRRRLLVVQPDPEDPLDRFAGLLTDAGLEVRVVQPFAQETLPDRLEEDGLLVLGGRMSVADDDKYPWLADIRRLLCHAVDLPRPALGICLGGQLLAQTFGGAVTAGDRGLEARRCPDSLATRSPRRRNVRELADAFPGRRHAR